MLDRSAANDVPAIDRVVVESSGLHVHWTDGRRSHFHSVWLRDNCGCQSCRVAQSGERLLFTADIPEDLAACDARVCESGNLSITWNDGHLSRFDRRWLAQFDYSSNSPASQDQQSTLWGAGVRLPEFEHADLMESNERLLEYLDALHAYGVAIVRKAPPVAGEVVRFAECIGVIRTVAFGTVHDVLNDPNGYNVAHTAHELKPHSDLASYSWPPSLQLLHYLSNEVSGGETILVDGWNVLSTLRHEHPQEYELLSSVSVPFKIFSATDDTYAVEPIIQHHPDGRVRIFRYSNQTLQPLQIHSELVEPFYEAYRKLGRLVSDDRFRVTIKAQSGDLMTIHNHRVLHGRRAYDPASGRRHLQDLYMEWDDVMSKRRVLRGHLPPQAWPTEDVETQSSARD